MPSFARNMEQATTTPMRMTKTVKGWGRRFPMRSVARMKRSIRRLEGGEGAGEVGEILERATEYTRLHFLSEELLMRRHAYPHHAEHEQEHQRMLEEIGAIALAYDAGRRAEALDALKIFRARLVGHIHAHDEELSRFIGGVDV